MYNAMPTEKLIIRLKASNTPLHKWIKMDEILFGRAEKGDEKALNYYTELAR
jgi:hypothetical protein